MHIHGERRVRATLSSVDAVYFGSFMLATLWSTCGAPILFLDTRRASEASRDALAGFAVTGYHKNHLGIRGTIEMICACGPSHVVLSEVGEELNGIIDRLAAMVQAAFGIGCTVGMMGKTGEFLPLNPTREMNVSHR